MTGETGGRRAHVVLAAAALLLGLLAALTGTGTPEPRARDAAILRSAGDTVPADSAPRRRIDGGRGCAW